MFDELVAKTCGTSGAGAVSAWARVEAAACARRLAEMVAMLDARYAADGSDDREQWYLDNWGAVCAELGAALHLSAGAASRLLLVATALRDRLPKVAALFAAGLISYRLVSTIVARTALIVDPDALRAVDAAIAAATHAWGPMSQDKTEHAIDALVYEFDPHAVRRTHTRARGRAIDVHLDDASGVATLWGVMFAHDGKALDARLDTLARTVCTADPRTHDQRRADALGALAAGADQLGCLCATPDCPATTDGAPPSKVVIHVVAPAESIAPPAPPPADAGPNDGEPTVEAGDPAAQHASLDGKPPPMFSKPLPKMTWAELVAESNAESGEPFATRPGVIIGGPLLPGPVAARAARSATIKTIVHPGLAPPEPRYRPSAALADFIRARDLTCRFPDCDEPATNCDLDHTIPYPHGPTQASNLKCVCRLNHLLKTFWGGPDGWRDVQLPDGTVIWTSPSGQTYTTHPGSRILFPELCLPTAPVILTDAPTPHTSGLTMPRRTITRAQARKQRINDERRLNEEQLAHPTGQVAAASRNTTADRWSTGSP